MNLYVQIIVVCLCLLIGLTFTAIIGFKIGQRALTKSEQRPEATSANAVLGGNFALLGLLIAFTFSGASSRFDHRRQIIVDEVNSLSTAWLRLDVLPQNARLAIDSTFTAYAQSRAILFELIASPDEAFAELEHTDHLQRQLWQAVIEATAAGPDAHRMLLLPALNDMFDIATKRTVAVQTHPPLLVYLALVVVALTCSGFLGYTASLGKRSTLSLAHVLVFSGTVSFTVYVIFDLEFARYGFVQLDEVNQLLVEFSGSLPTTP